VPSTSAFDDQVAATMRYLKRLTRVSDAELSEQLGVSRAVVNQRMTGQSRWQAAELSVLADYFGVPVDVLYAPTKQALLRAIGDYDVLDQFPEQRP